MTPLFLAQIATYNSEAFYAGMHDWMRTTPTSRKLSVAISSKILDSLPSSISLMFLNDTRFASDGIAKISLLLTDLNPSSNENLLLAISDLTSLKIQLVESSIDYMYRIRGILQRMQGLTIDRIIPLLAITSLDHDQYPGVKSCYLVGDTAQVNCDLLQLSGLLYIKETRQRALEIPNAPPFNTIYNRVSNTPTNHPQNGCPDPKPPQPPTQSSAVAYPPAMGVPCKCIATMMREDKSYRGCHFNHPIPRLKFHQDVECPALAKHGYICQKDVTASSKVVDIFNNKLPKMTEQSRTSNPVSKRVSDNSSSDQVSARRFHSPSV